jgi:hypothetical protein
MTNKTKSTRVQPKLEDLLPTPELRVAFEEASAALEAGQLVRAMRNKAGLHSCSLLISLGWRNRELVRSKPAMGGMGRPMRS